MALVTFAIPMAPVIRCDYWDHAMKNLEVTLNSMLGQTNDSYNIIVAKTHGDPTPDCCNNDKITVVSVKDGGEWSLDKDNKTLAMLGAHRDLGNKYFLRTDWDDIFHKGLVQWVVENENDNGFIITDGYFYKPSDQMVIPCTPWFMHCGSCHLVNYSEDELTNGVHHPKKFTFHHQHVHEYRHKIGRPLQAVPFRAGLYAITGKNISTPKHERILKGKEWFEMSKELKEEYSL